jgi:hypothetical protein
MQFAGVHEIVKFALPHELPAGEAKLLFETAAAVVYKLLLLLLFQAPKLAAQATHYRVTGRTMSPRLLRMEAALARLPQKEIGRWLLVRDLCGCASQLGDLVDDDGIVQQVAQVRRIVESKLSRQKELEAVAFGSVDDRALFDKRANDGKSEAPRAGNRSSFMASGGGAASSDSASVYGLLLGGSGTGDGHAEWMPDHASSVCCVCFRGFTLTFRRHHCRTCGRVVCHLCAPKRSKGNRVCTDCESATGGEHKSGPAL